MIHRLAHTLLGMWVTWVVWLTLVLPYVAYSTPALRREMELPWWLRAALWVLQRTWPYSKCYRLGAAMNGWPWRSSFPLRPKYHEQQLELPFDSDAGQGTSKNAPC